MCNVDMTWRRKKPWLARHGLLAALVSFWLLVVWVDRSYQSEDWLALAVWLAFICLVIALAARSLGPKLPGRTCLAALAAFAAYVVWVALSAIWAPDAGLALEAAARAGFYLLFFGLALVALSQPRGIAGVRGALLAVGVLMVACAIVALLVTPATVRLFADGRIAFPLRYTNACGTYYLLLCWPLLWMAAEPRSARWRRAIALGSLTAVLELSLLTQSRGAMLGLGVGGIFYFLLSSARVRSLIFLVAPAALAAASFFTLDAYYTRGPESVGRWPAVLWLTGSLVVAAAVGLGLTWMDGRIDLSGRLRSALSGVVVLVMLAGLTLGFLWFQREVGDVSDWVVESASTFVGEGSASEPGRTESRFEQGGGGGRSEMWHRAWLGFLDAPVTGNGAGSFPYIDERYGGTPDRDRSQAHSLEFDLLNETGVIGAVLFFAWFGLVVGAALAPRRASRRVRARTASSAAAPETRAAHLQATYDRAWRVALVSGAVVWLGQASVDWLWQVGPVTTGCLLLLSFALCDDRSMARFP